MGIRKVLLLTYHFPPSGAVAVYRMLGLVSYLPKFGWQPVVVAPPCVPWEPEDPSLLAQVPPDTPIERVPFASGFAGKIARYFAPEAHWLYQAWPASQRMIAEHRPDAVITSSPPGCVHRLGLWVQRKFNMPWLACFRDPWITNSAIKDWTLHRRYERRLERKVIRHANRLIANTPINLQGWANAYPEHVGKMLTITNGYDPERFARTTNASPRNGVLTILHAGELYHGRDPRPFLDALQQLAGSAVQVDFLGRKTEGAYDLSAEISKRGLNDRVHLIGQIPYGDAIDRMLRADILLLVHTPGQALGVPAKLYEYLGAGRPILALAELDGDIAWVLRESKVLHRIARPNDIAAIKQALDELMSLVNTGAEPAPDPNALQRFTRESMAQRFAECLNEVTRVSK